jgi:CheY-like chemotaxis protein
MNGTIGFESILGEGSFFYFEMPLLNETPTSLSSNEVNQKEQIIMVDNSQKKILYIEDMESNLKLVESIMLNRAQVELITATNGIDGIEIARTRMPDLILLDIHLPGLSGLEIFKKLQGIKETHDIPVIALSADAMDENIDIALEMGFTSYITKPIRVKEFLKIIDNTLQV